MTSILHYTITELATEFDVTPRTLRFYEEKGFLTPHREGTKRLYSRADRTRLKLILRGKRIGLSLDESIEIIDLYDDQNNNQEQFDALLKSIQLRKYTLRQQLNDIQQTIRELEIVEERILNTTDTH